MRWGIGMGLSKTASLINNNMIIIGIWTCYGHAWVSA